MPWPMVGETEKTRSRPPRRTCSFSMGHFDIELEFDLRIFSFERLRAESSRVMQYRLDTADA